MTQKYNVMAEMKNGKEILKLSTYNPAFAVQLRDSIEYDNNYRVVWIDTIFEG